MLSRMPAACVRRARSETLTVHDPGDHAVETTIGSGRIHVKNRPVPVTNALTGSPVSGSPAAFSIAPPATDRTGDRRRSFPEAADGVDRVDARREHHQAVKSECGADPFGHRRTVGLQESLR
jgi:hypothetical protein